MAEIFQSTPPVKAATFGGGNSGVQTMISIHAAREGGDDTGVTKEGAFGISIHAAREGGDFWRQSYLRKAGHFNPRRP